MKNTSRILKKDSTKPNPVQSKNGQKGTKSGHAKKTWLIPELKITTLRDCPTEKPWIFDKDDAEKFWRENIEPSPYFNADVESLWVFIVTTRYRLIGFQQISQGTRNTILSDPLLVFRAAVVKCAASIVLAHNHPSGDPSPSDADIKVTRDLIRGGRLLKIQLLDHIIFGSCGTERSCCSLREMGHFYNVN